MTIARGATKLTSLFVLNMFVLLAWTGGAVAVAKGIAEAAFGHLDSEKLGLKLLNYSFSNISDNICRFASPSRCPP